MNVNLIHRYRDSKHLLQEIAIMSLAGIYYAKGKYITLWPQNKCNHQ